MGFVVIVPTYNAGNFWCKWISSVNSQNCKPIKVINIDSSSNDETVTLSRKNDFEIFSIAKTDFSHGKTRNLGINLSIKYSPDFVIFMTQDALLDDCHAFEKIISYFDDESVSAVCGHQIPHSDANPIAIHARLFNYPNQSQTKSFTDINRLGLKVAFMSNSFAAYRFNIFKKIGGFPENTILAEDMYLAAKMILDGYKVGYCAEATVRHSHNYTPGEEFRRYFDTGVFHACEPWIQEKLGGASGEGLRFIKSEMKFLWHNYPWWIPRALLTNLCKILGYKCGRYYKKIPSFLRPKFSMYKSYWLQQHTLK